MSTTVTVVSQNMAYSGLFTSSGERDPHRWDGLMATIDSHEPDILLLQEVGKWEDHNRQPIARAEQALGMRIVGITTRPAGGGTALMIRPNTIKWAQWEDRYSDQTLHGFGVGVLRLPGLDTPLATISAHLNPFSAKAAVEEAQLLVARAYRYGGLGLIGGDINHFSHHDAPSAIPNPDHIPPYNRSSRWITTDAGDVVPNRTVGRALRLGGLTDVAVHVAGQTGNSDVLAPTGRGKCRVDQFWATPPLVPAITGYAHHPHKHSDHSLITMRLDTSLVDLDAAIPEWI